MNPFVDTICPPLIKLDAETIDAVICANCTSDVVDTACPILIVLAVPPLYVVPASYVIPVPAVKSVKLLPNEIPDIVLFCSCEFSIAPFRNDADNEPVNPVPATICPPLIKLDADIVEPVIFVEVREVIPAIVVADAPKEMVVLPTVIELFAN